jgi:UDP-N-acetyl-2-amino-2-deoxyglucuronate dehydrogenase
VAEQTPINYGLIGCGRIGQRHAEQMTRTGKLVAVCDTMESRANDFATNYKVRAYSNHIEMFEAESQLNVVSVCTPNGNHAEHSIAALNRGIHVICEKPMALEIADCSSMIKAAIENDRVLFVVKQNRYNPPVAAIKKLMDQGRLGKVYSVQLNCFWNRNKEYYQDSWRGDTNLDGGTLFTQFSHFIDLIYWLFGEVDEVSAMTSNFAHQGVIDFEDTGVALLKFRTGAIATLNYTVNSFRKNMEGSLTIFAEKGTIKIGGEYLNKLEYQQIEDLIISDLPASSSANNYGQYTGSMSNHNQVYDNVVDVLHHGGEIMTTSYDALKTVEIIRRIYAAAKKTA